MAIKKRARRILRSLDLVFSQKSVDETTDPLLKALKLTFTRLNITSEEFGARHLDWWANGGGKGSKSPVHTSLNNFRQAMIDKRNITWEYFVKIVLMVLKLDLVRLSITFRHPVTKEIITINSDETFEHQKKLREEEEAKNNRIT